MDQKSEPKIEPAKFGAKACEAFGVALDPSAETVAGKASLPATRQPLIQYWKFRFTGSKIHSDESLQIALEVEWVKYYGFQLEKASIEHYQGTFEVEPRKRFSEIGPYFQSIFPELKFDGRDYLQKQDSKAAERYCMKENTRVRGPWWKGDKYDEIAKETVYRINIELRFWQQRIVKILDGPSDDRKIWWFYEPYGGLGKTTFQKWIYQNYENVLVLGGKAADMKNGIVEYEKVNKCLPKLILINIPKTFNMDYFSPSGTEEVKDMFFYSGKYEGGMVHGRPPKVLIFANAKPIDTESMAADRWRIVRLPDGPARETKVVELDWSIEGPIDEYME